MARLTKEDEMLSGKSASLEDSVEKRISDLSVKVAKNEFMTGEWEKLNAGNASKEVEIATLTERVRNLQAKR